MPNSSSDSQMCSCWFRPACDTKMTVSTPAASYRSTRSAIWFGVPTAPRSDPSPACRSFTPSCSSSPVGVTISRANPNSFLCSWNSFHTFVKPGT